MNKKPGYRPCPECGEYCPIIKKSCPICEFVFPTKEKPKPVPQRIVAPEILFTEKELAKIAHRNSKLLRFPAEYDGYEIRGLIGTPAGPCPIKLPTEINQQAISVWAHKIRLKYLEQKRFITNEGLMYHARKFIDWASPEFRLFRLFMEKVEDYKKASEASES